MRHLRPRFPSPLLLAALCGALSPAIALAGPPSLPEPTQPSAEDFGEITELNSEITAEVVHEVGNLPSCPSEFISEGHFTADQYTRWTGYVRYITRLYQTGQEPTRDVRLARALRHEARLSGPRAMSELTSDALVCAGRNRASAAKKWLPAIREVFEARSTTRPTLVPTITRAASVGLAPLGLLFGWGVLRRRRDDER